MKVVCCICNKVLVPGPDDRVSHGHCGPCNIKFLWLAGFNEEELTDFANKQALKTGLPAEVR